MLAGAIKNASLNYTYKYKVCMLLQYSPGLPLELTYCTYFAKYKKNGNASTRIVA